MANLNKKWNCRKRGQMQQTWNKKYYFEEEQLEYWSLLLSLCYIVWALLTSKPPLPLVLPLPK